MTLRAPYCQIPTTYIGRLTLEQGGGAREPDSRLFGGRGVHLDHGRRRSDRIGVPHRLRCVGPHVSNSDWWPVSCSGRVIHLVVSEECEERTGKWVSFTGHTDVDANNLRSCYLIK